MAQHCENLSNFPFAAVDCIEKPHEPAPVDDRFKLPPTGKWSTKARKISQNSNINVYRQNIALTENSLKCAVLDALVDQLDEHIRE